MPAWGLCETVSVASPKERTEYRQLAVDHRIWLQVQDLGEKRVDVDTLERGNSLTSRETGATGEKDAMH